MKLHFFTHAENRPPVLTIRFFTRADNQSFAKPKRPSAGVRVTKNQFRIYTDEEKQFIRDNWQTMTTGEIAQALNRSKAGVATTAWRYLNLRKTKEAKFMAACKGQQAREDAYSETEKQYMRDNWQIMSSVEIGAAIGRTPASVKKYGRVNLGLLKTAEAIQHISSRPNAGQFKKGHLPQTTIYSDGPVIRPRLHRESGRTYLYIRLAYGQWQQYHQWLWTQAHGPVPQGHIVVFKNGDQTDVRLDNLEMITMAENVKRNSGSLNLPDGYVAHLLAVRDKPTQALILQQAPELIELKRAELLLNRAVREEEQKATET